MSRTMIILLAFILSVIMLAAASADEPTVSYLDATVPGPDNMIKPMPADGSTAATNPLSFRWLPELGAVSYNLQYSQNKDFNSPATASGLKLNLHHPAKTVKAGKWYWRYQAVLADGKTSAWSSVRSFTVPKDAVEFALPPIDEVMQRVPKGRPRLFIRPEELESFRQARFGDRKELWAEVEKQIEAQLEKPMMKEPVPYPDGKWNVDIWREYMVQARGMGDRIEHLAFGYLMTGEKKYADAAKAQIMELTTWDPAGPSSYKYNDEVAMPIILSVSRAYDWMYDAFTPEERVKIQEMMRIRGGEIYGMYLDKGYHAHPFDSHATRVLKFLGQESISFLGEIPEASDWFDYLMNIFFCVYPPWGGTDGSYHEGPSYWSAYFGWAQQFATALKSATGIDLYEKPFFRNTGYWALYCIPPHGAMAPFGDGTSGRPGVGQKINLYRLASVYDDPYLRWYADNMPGELPKSLMMYLWHDDSVKAKAPSDLPQSRAFPDCGVVAMHSDLANGKEDIYMLLKSDPYGSISHAYADQNSFYLQAFGEPLAISSGYYPWYGSDHHTKWTWQTRAHNSILVNGEGQVPRSASSKGRIVETLFSPQIDYSCQDATQAYGGRLDKFLRHVLFFRPGYFVMMDELDAKEQSTYDWLLHSWEKMEVAPASCRLTISRGDARLLVQFIEPQKLSLSQTDQFTAPPEKEGLANQWHLTASTTNKSRRGEFLTVMYPYKAGSEASLPKIERIDNSGIVGARIASGSSEDVILLSILSPSMEPAGFISDARMLAVRKEKDKVTAFFMRDGSQFGEDIRTNAFVTAAMEISKGRRNLKIHCPKETKIKVVIPEIKPGDLKNWTPKVSRSAITDDMRDPRILRGTIKVDGKNLSPSEYTFDYQTGEITLDFSPGEHTVDITARAPNQN